MYQEEGTCRQREIMAPTDAEMAAALSEKSPSLVIMIDGRLVDVCPQINKTRWSRTRRNMVRTKGLGQTTEDLKVR